MVSMATDEQEHGVKSKRFKCEHEQTTRKVYTCIIHVHVLIMYKYTCHIHVHVIHCQGDVGDIILIIITMIV